MGHPQFPTINTDVEPLDGLSLEDYVAQPRFNRSLKYQSETTKGEINASYAVVGNQEPGADAFIYLGGIFGGRYHGFWIDYLAKVKGYKGIFPDRPGLGHFTAVPIEQRVTVFLEAIPLILADAQVDRVGLIALSGGTQYALNLLWHRPDLIRTDVPIFLMSPWVPPWKSGVRLHMVMSYVPTYFTRSAGRLASFLLKRLIAHVENEQKGKKSMVDETRIRETCGGDSGEMLQRRNYFRQQLFTEETDGSAEDYLLGIKDQKDTCGLAADYEEYVRELSARCQAEGTRLEFQTFFAAGDSVIGTRGIQYFNETFGSPIAQKGFDYRSEVVENTDHEGIAFPEIGVVGKIMDTAFESIQKKTQPSRP